MASLEGEILLLGIYKNVEDLEAHLSLPELEAIVTAAREKEMRHHRFLAALKGIDLDEDSSKQNRVEEMKQRIEAERSGRTVEELELSDFGFDVETE